MKPTSKNVSSGDFGAINTDTAAGFIGTVMQPALNSGDASTSFVHTIDQLSVYNAAGNFGSEGYENAYREYLYSVLLRQRLWTVC